MKLIIVRHGETEENAEGIHQGQRHGKLSNVGIEQTKKLGTRLKDEKFDIVYCSDLQRCKDTAKEIMKFHSSIPVHYTKEIRERRMGEFEGRRRDSEEGFKYEYNLDDDLLKSK